MERGLIPEPLERPRLHRRRTVAVVRDRELGEFRDPALLKPPRLIPAQPRDKRQMLSGHASPAGFIVLNGTVTAGPLAGAQVHQRSNLVGAQGSTTSWTGELRLMPASA